MSTNLDLFDIQGSITKAYVRYAFPRIRYICYQIHDGKAGRDFVTALLPMITNAEPWSAGQPIPNATTNIAFTYEGMKQLGLPEASLHSFPSEFSMGMKARREIVGDTGVNAPANWDPVWGTEDCEQAVHVLVWINGNVLLVDGKPGSPDVALERIEQRYQEIRELADRSGGKVQELSGHVGAEGNDMPYQEASVIYKNGRPMPTEHFGYTDGISEPYFKGSGADPTAVIGGGKRTRLDPTSKAGWEPLETGEFLLGHKDEAFEYPKAPVPTTLARNGTFMVYRKLHQNVGTFHAFVERVGKNYPGGPDELSAKLVGRWKNGAPLTTFPTKAEADAFHAEYLAAQDEARKTGDPKARARYEALKLKLVAFDFDDDLDGSRCPVGAHIRRVNPRGALEFGKTGAFNTPGALINRRRIIRRGLPYGEVTDPTRDDGNHGIIIMVLNANINRQFEFVQQQWINYGNDFRLANDQDPILGNHGPPDNPEGRMVVPADPSGDQPPFFCGKIPTFVETRGGDYFFIPSLTALRMIGEGIVDPT